MSSTNLEQILKQLRSDKSKDRQQALTLLREVFGKKGVIESFDPKGNKGNGNIWLIVFQSLFESVLNERKSASRKGASVSASEQRLREAASTVRWLIEKSVTYWRMDKNVGRAIMKHLIQVMKNHGELYTPVALDYVKALRVICAFGPHLDHMLVEESLWINILSLSFAIVLGDDLDSSLDDENGVYFDSSDGGVSIALTNEDDGTVGRKRKRACNNDERRNVKTHARTTSPEQIECVAIIAVFLRSHQFRLLRENDDRLVTGIASRLGRFFKTFHFETSAHLDAIAATQAFLESLSLNARDQTTNFAISLWDPILRLWPTKSRSLKERLLMIMIEIFPYLALKDTGFDKLEGFHSLIRLLRHDLVGNRPVFDELDTTSLRYEIKEGHANEPFCYRTFRAGSAFTSNQAIDWCLIELMSDITYELHLLVESNFDSPVKSLTERKRARIEDPIRTLLHDNQTSSTGSRTVILHLQIISFIIERHWTSLHKEMRLEIIESLVSAVTTDDAVAQSWIFLALSSLIVADKERGQSDLTDAHRDSLWSHSIRRTNVPAICRSACHLAHALLISEMLSPPRIHAEINTMALDLTVQGPSAPHDAVCHFLARCIRIAHQDTHLYRLRLDEKVIAWLIENWSTSMTTYRSAKSRSSSNDTHLPQDILLLLQLACDLTFVTDDLLSAVTLPTHPIVSQSRRRAGTKVIQDYLLHQHIACSTHRNIISDKVNFGEPSNFEEPGARIRKISGFLLKAIEKGSARMEETLETGTHLTSQNVTQLLDLSILTFLFESTLLANGVMSNKRTLSSSSGLLKLLASYLQAHAWDHREAAELLSHLRIISTCDPEESKVLNWETIVEADKRSGVHGARRKRISRRDRKCSFLLKRLWQCSEFQEGFEAVLGAVRRLLRALTASSAPAPTSDFGSQPLDDQDEFAPIRAVNTPTLDASMQLGERVHLQGAIAACIETLSLPSQMRVCAGELAGDDSLVRIILDCADDVIFQDLLDPFLLQVQTGNLQLSSEDLDCLLDRLEQPLKSYNHGTSDALHALVIKLLHATIHVWLQDSVPEDLQKVILLVYKWLAKYLRDGTLCWWETRDAFRRLCSSYLSIDPKQRFMAEMGGDILPDRILLQLLADCDIRVRFGAASAYGHIFGSVYMEDKDPMTVYSGVRDQLCTVLSDYERMLTRFVCLANILVASSAVRRGPYWHLIETCLYESTYVKHIESVLAVATQQIGLKHFRDLFEAYATQLAYSIRLSGRDFFLLPPTLLGYEDKKKCAQATFISFSPTNFLTDDHDGRPFAHHCRLIGTTVSNGLHVCFPNIIAYFIATRIDDQMDSSETGDVTFAITNKSLLDAVCQKFSMLGTHDQITKLICKKVDGIISAVLCMCGDMGVDGEESIAIALRRSSRPDASIEAYRVMSQFQSESVEGTHSPNIPAFSAFVVLRALEWLSSVARTTYTEPATYHVLQCLFTAIQHCFIINEQIRLLTALVLWVALNEDQFANATLLRVLMSGAASCLEQAELAHFAKGVLGWAFSKARVAQNELPHLMEVALRCAGIAARFHASTDSYLREFGTQLRSWLEQHVIALWQNVNLRASIAVFLDAWPDGCSEGFSVLQRKTTESVHVPIFSLQLPPKYRFKAIRNLPRLAEGPFMSDDFPCRGFWQLKECIPANGLSSDETIAFADLLVAHSGQIRSYHIDSRPGKSISTRHINYSIKEGEYAAKKAIIHYLLERMVIPDGNVVDAAYRSLRLLAGHEPLSSLTFGSWPSEFRGDVTFLDFCPSALASQTTGFVAVSDIFSQPVGLSAHFDVWICSLASGLCATLATEDQFFAQIIDLFKSSVELSNEGLPVLLKEVLGRGRQKRDDKYRVTLSRYFTDVICNKETDVHCHRAIIDAIIHLRNFQLPESKDPLGYNRWLDINFSLLSNSAVICGAYTTALLFLELAAEYAQHGRRDAVLPEQILFDIYSHIDEPDGFYGIRSNNLQNDLLRRFRHENQWDKAFQLHGAQFEIDREDYAVSLGIAESLHSFGFNKLAMSTLRSFGDLQNSESSSLTYQLGWRTGTWDLPDVKAHETSGTSLYTALRAVHRDFDPRLKMVAVSKSMEREVQQLRVLGNENLFEIRQASQTLMCLTQIRRWISGALASRIVDGSKLSDPDVRAFFTLQKDLQFTDVECMIATRISLLQAARQKDQKAQIGTALSEEAQKLLHYEKLCLLQLSEAARRAFQPQIALNSIVKLLSLDSESTFEVQQELANVLWLQNEQKSAVTCLKKEIGRRKRSNSDPSTQLQLAYALAQLGEWTSEACLENPKVIGEEYFAPAIQLLANGFDDASAGERRSKIYYKYALFNERQYHEITSSDDIRRLTVYQAIKNEEIAERAKQIQRSTSATERKELSGQQRKATELQKQDTAQLEEFMNARQAYLNQAVSMFAHCLGVADTYDTDAAIRFCSLWFANFSGDVSAIRQVIKTIPSRKFVFLAHQLTARLSSQDEPNTSSQAILQELLYRMCSEHPFHSLYQVYLLQSSYAPDARRTSQLASEGSQIDRAAAATELFERIVSTSNSKKACDIKHLCDAYLQWAKFPIKKESRKREQGVLYIPPKLSIRNVSNIKVPVATAQLPLDPTMRYEDCVWIVGYSDKYETAGGINVPKICICKGSDGENYKQLFKGEGDDDLRQDAVMEQVFELCNQVLSKDQETRRRDLHIRTYKVIPLAAQAGLLEFVGKTRPLQWLVHAHELYNPKDLLKRDCDERLRRTREKFQHIPTELKTSLIAVFDTIRKRFRPVMRHFFTEHRKDPQAWFEMRLQYSRSVAVTSIIGHILGLGDRHLSNILIDTVTGEVVHIDLGIAFEQGKLLPIPERVPFRLTADMIDGFGTSGTEGVFRRCAEETLRVLREGSGVIKTVLEVFKYDPLHSWTASAVKIRKAQGPDTGQVYAEASMMSVASTSTTTRLGHANANVPLFPLPPSAFGASNFSHISSTEAEAADRALTSVARKLDKSLSVAYTVNELIGEASDVANLALMFFGWAPCC